MQPISIIVAKPHSSALPQQPLKDGAPAILCSAAPSKNLRFVGYWLLLCAAMVFVMALLGATTRLTGSGLSMVTWRPYIEALPPLTEEAWQKIFGLYQQSPQYIQVNMGMSLAEFKLIFFWEWLHRVWGKLISVVFFMPLCFWAVRRVLPRSLLFSLLGVMALGVMQAFLGWFMVKSGLVDRPEVSHYRLAFHLCMAFAIYSALLNIGFGVLVPVTRSDDKRVRKARKFSLILLCLAALTIFWGAMVAGLKAGLVYNSFPLMDGKIVPEELLQQPHFFLALFSNHAGVQFIHRCLAFSTFGFACFLYGQVTKLYVAPVARTATKLVLGALLLQITLGVSTLLWQVPLLLAVMHQAGAMVVLASLIWLLHHMRYEKTSEMVLP
ncbi:MAG: COX15/CtaA family protein [Alphaproteobacteria bacterium]